MIRFSPPPANDFSSAARTCCVDTCWSNLVMTTVPPANSTPFGIPWVAITKIPARMTSQDRTSACQRHRRKLQFGFVKICISDTQRRNLLAARERQLEQRLRHEDRREQAR